MALPSANPQSVDRKLRSERKPQPQTLHDPKEILSEEAFRRMISLERKRSERTQRPFVLLLMDTGRAQPTQKNGRILLDILSALESSTRETDVMGWYETNTAVGVMFTEIALENNLMLSAILGRISEVLRGRSHQRTVQSDQVFVSSVPRGVGSQQSRASEQPNSLS